MPVDFEPKAVISRQQLVNRMADHATSIVDDKKKQDKKNPPPPPPVSTKPTESAPLDEAVITSTSGAVAPGETVPPQTYAEKKKKMKMRPNTPLYKHGKAEQLHYNFCWIRGRRPTQEDAHMSERLANGMYLFGVFDGHGNADVSNMVSKIMPELLKKEITKAMKSNPKADLTPGIVNAFKTIDKQLYKDLDAEQRNGGSCAAVALITSDKVYSINLGDSRVYTLGKFDVVNEDKVDEKTKETKKEEKVVERPAILHVTDDHKPLRQDEKARITANGGHVFFGRICTEQVFAGLAVSRAFGDFQYKKCSDDDKTGNFVSIEPEITVTELSKVGAIIITCDGVTDALEDNDIVKIFSDSKGRAKYITMKAYNNGSGDNISACVIDFNNFTQINEDDRDEIRYQEAKAKQAEKKAEKQKEKDEEAGKEGVEASNTQASSSKQNESTVPAGYMEPNKTNSGSLDSCLGTKL